MDKEFLRICSRCGSIMKLDSDNIYRYESFLCIICGNVEEKKDEEKPKPNSKYME
jgi:DNA-directed RNA polymerase subunit M/transcription elongation factor TFIIS